jgi:hypothetical protein
MLLTYLLLVAMPMQGFAAATMLACGPNHDSLHGSVAQVVATGKQAQHPHSGGHSHKHEISAASAENASTGEAAQAQTVSGVPSAHTDADFKCDACGPCCLAAALTTDVVIRVVPVSSSADFPDPTCNYLSPALGVLDRPPRHVLA